MNDDLLKNVILDRARGYCVSVNDPISSASHCLLGTRDFKHDFVVTSTLASQLPPALGRALGIQLVNALSKADAKLTKDAISFVSLGDGSVNNAHCLSALNMAEYAIHHNIKCPLLIGISNNKICISLKDVNKWLDVFVSRYKTIHKIYCNGTNILDVYVKFNHAIQYVRKYKKPSIIVFNEMPRYRIFWYIMTTPHIF